MEEKLFNISKNEYGDSYDDHVIEQYKIYADSIQKTSDRRHSANNYFIAINSALLTILGLTFKVDFFNENYYLRMILVLAGAAICLIFWLLFRSYKQLNSGKFKVLHKIEEKMPMSIFEYEWEMLGRGKNKKLYFPFTHVELMLPILLGVVYIILGIAFIFN